jgi:hypothetical protein
MAERGRPRAFDEEEVLDPRASLYVVGDHFWPYVVQVPEPAQPRGAGPRAVGQCRNPWNLSCLVPAVRPVRGR